MNEIVPDDLRDRVIDVVSEVKPSDLDNYERIQNIENKRTKLNTLLQAWGKQQNEERALRAKYAKWLLSGLFVQMVLVDATFFAIGMKWLAVDQWVASSFILAVLADIGAMTTIVTKYLFPKQNSDILDIIEKL